MFENQVQPAWYTLKAAAIYSGLSTRLLEDLVREKLIVSSSVIKPGATRGRRLVSRVSLDAWIEQGIGNTNDVTFRPKK